MNNDLDAKEGDLSIGWRLFRGAVVLFLGFCLVMNLADAGKGVLPKGPWIGEARTAYKACMERVEARQSRYEVESVETVKSERGHEFRIVLIITTEDEQAMIDQGEGAFVEPSRQRLVNCVVAPDGAPHLDMGKVESRPGHYSL